MKDRHIRGLTSIAEYAILFLAVVLAVGALSVNSCGVLP